MKDKYAPIPPDFVGSKAKIEYFKEPTKEDFRAIQRTLLKHWTWTYLTEEYLPNMGNGASEIVFVTDGKDCELARYIYQLNEDNQPCNYWEMAGTPEDRTARIIAWTNVPVPPDLQKEIGACFKS